MHKSKLARKLDEAFEGISIEKFNEITNIPIEKLKVKFATSNLSNLGRYLHQNHPDVFGDIHKFITRQESYNVRDIEVRNGRLCVLFGNTEPRMWNVSLTAERS